MKKIVLILSAWLPLLTAAQIVFDFENGLTDDWTFSLPGRWAADSADALSGSYSLHHVFDNPDAATDIALFSLDGLCTGCSQTSWSFSLRHGADPSSSNRWLYILMSDKGFPSISDIKSINGYAVGVNLTGYDDTLRLWHISGGSFIPVVTADLNWQNDIGTDEPAEINIVRKTSGEWSLKISAGTLNKTSAGWATQTHTPRYAGILFTYTSARDRLLWIDDIIVDGIFMPDTLPPEVVSVTALTPCLLQAVFSEDTNDAEIYPGSVTLSGGLNVSSVDKTTTETYHLKLDGNIGNRVQSAITFSNLCDLAGNCALSHPFYFIPVYAETGEIVISEIMSDPSPPVYLPEEEFIEISNLGSDSLSLMNFILIAEKDTVVLPPVWINAGEDLIICGINDTSLFSRYGITEGIQSFPSLSDNGETLALRDGTGKMIHAVTYSTALYNDDLRSGGGWSMEMTDTANPFNAPDAWHASADPSGGTPGRDNSRAITAPDTRCPEVIAAWPVKTDCVKLLFDESIMNAFNGEEWYIDGEKALFSVTDDIADRSIIVQGKNEFERNVIHTLQIPDEAVDYARNRISVPDIKFGIPDSLYQGDILFNELLFDPVAPCPDFIELYNNSQKIADLSRLVLSASVTESTKTTVYPAANVPRQLLPGDYVVLTTNRKEVAESFTCSNKDAIFEIPAIPTMPDDKGHLMLSDKSLNTIDRVEYSSSMHMQFLSQTEGISLEKVNPALPSGDLYNWHSASETCNWGSPGEKNSTFLSGTPGGHGLTLSAKRVSPDGDGFEDVVSVSLIPGGGDNVITITIYNERGYPVKVLAERFYADEGASFIWDGTADDGSRLAAGLYMILAESYSPGGLTHRWKEVCAILYR